MFHPTLHKSTRILFAPLITFCEWLGNHYPALLLRIRYYVTFHKRLDLNNPQDLNQKILWAKLYSDTSLWVTLADKYAVRRHIEELGLQDILVKLYAVWYNVSEVDLDTLPDSFILKANNGDGKGTNKIIHKKDLTPQKRQEVLAMIDTWLKRKNIGSLHAEPHYNAMKPCVIAEEVLPLAKGQNSLTDYKFWCFGGKVQYIWVCNDRNANGNSAHVLTYDKHWNPHPEYSVFTSDYLQGKPEPKPANFDRMIQIAETLSAGFPQVRIDLYNIDGKIYFGEYTFTSQGGFMTFYTDDFLRRLGSFVDICDFKLRAKSLNIQ